MLTNAPRLSSIFAAVLLFISEDSSPATRTRDVQDVLGPSRKPEIIPCYNPADEHPIAKWTRDGYFNYNDTHWLGESFASSDRWKIHVFTEGTRYCGNEMNILLILTPTTGQALPRSSVEVALYFYRPQDKATVTAHASCQFQKKYARSEVFEGLVKQPTIHCDDQGHSQLFPGIGDWQMKTELLIGAEALTSPPICIKISRLVGPFPVRVVP